MRNWTRWRTPHRMAMVLTAATQRCDTVCAISELGYGCLLSAANRSVTGGQGAACCRSEAASLHACHVGCL